MQPKIKLLPLPLLPKVKIIRKMEFPDLLRFANSSPDFADLVRQANIILLKLKVLLKQNSVTIDFKAPNDEERVFNFVINEKDYTGEDGFEWSGLKGLKFFESPVVGEGLDLPEGPPEDVWDVSDDESGEEDGSEDGSENGEDEDPQLEDDQDRADPEEALAPAPVPAPVPAPALDPNWYCKVSSSTNQTVFEVADLLITYLFDLFGSTELHHMALWLSEDSKKLIENHQQLRKCDNLAVADFWRWEMCRPVSKELMEWSIDAVEVKEDSSYWCNVIGEFKWDKGFKPKWVDVAYGHWVQMNAILDSESETLCFHRHIPSSTFINSILKAWISNEKMHNLNFMSWGTRESQLHLLTERLQNEATEGIPEAVVTEEEHERITPRFHHYDGNRGRFVKFFRRVDCKLAVVFVNFGIRQYQFLAF